MNCIKKLGVFVTILFALNSLWALDESKVQEFRLDNGLKIITYELHTAPVIYSQLTYNVGSKYEPFNQTGISHVVEHMMFKGTRRFPKGTIAELISANGGIFNAYTSTDITVYFELLPKNKIDLAFDIESERMHKCEFDPEEFKSELNVIMEERKMRTENSATGLRREELNTLIYKYHPYRNPIIGWMEDLRNLTRDQAYHYYRTYYTPNNATLVLVGDFDTQEIVAKVKQYFGGIPKGPDLPSPNFFRIPQIGKKTLDFKHPDILNEEIQFYFAAPPRSHEDGAALFVAGNILGSRSATSRLYKKLVREKRLCQSVGAGAAFTKDPSTFSVFASLLPGSSLEEVEALIWHEIDSLKNTPVQDYDLQKIKNRLNFNELTGSQYCDQIGGQIATYDNYINWHFINEWQRRILAVTADDIMRVAQKYLTPDNMVICYSHPDTIAGRRKVVEEEETPPTPEPDSELPILDMPSLEPDTETPVNEEVRKIYYPKLEEVIAPNPIVPLVKTAKLNNGVPVYFIESHEYPTVLLLGFFETGRMPEEVQNPGIRQMVETLITRGTKSRSYEQMIEERSFTPYQFELSQSWNKVVFQSYSLSKDTDKMLQMGYEILSQPSFPEEEINKVRPLLINNAINYRSTERMKAFYAMFEKVFEGHQYALPYAGDPEVYKRLKRDDLVKFYEKYYSPETMKLVVVGDFKPQEMLKALNATYGKWNKKSGDAHLKFTDIKPLKGKTVYVYPNSEYKQCRVDIAFNPIEGGIKNDNPDLPAIHLLESILCGSSLTSRMGKELRDKQGLCYNIRSNLWIRPHGGYWNIRTETDKANVNKMIRGIFAEIEKVQQNGVTEEELEKAKARKIAMLTMNTRTPDDIGVIVFDMLQDKRPLDYFDKSKQRILSVSAADIQRVARKYLDTQNYIIAVSGNIPENALDEFK